MKNIKIFAIFGLIIIFLWIFLMKNLENSKNTKTNSREFYENYEENFIPENLDFSLEWEIFMKQDLNWQKFYEKSILPWEINIENQNILISEKIFENNIKVKEFLTKNGEKFSQIENIDPNYILENK